MSNAKERGFISAITARPDIRLFFIFGQDESAVADIAAQMAAQLVGAERVDIDSDRIRNDPALLADEASALSLFGDKGTSVSISVVRKALQRSKICSPLKAAEIR